MITPCCVTIELALHGNSAICTGAVSLLTGTQSLSPSNTNQPKFHSARTHKANKSHHSLCLITWCPINMNELDHNCKSHKKQRKLSITVKVIKDQRCSILGMIRDEATVKMVCTYSLRCCCMHSQSPATFQEFHVQAQSSCTTWCS